MIPITGVLRQRLIDSMSPDGGWPYYPGRRARLEPTCWAALALSTSEDNPGNSLESTHAQLLRLQRPDGALLDPGVLAPNHAWNGLALLAGLAVTPSMSSAWREGVLAALLAARGIALPPGPIKQNNQLQAWSWVDGTFSWVEPTAVCLLALKKAGATGELADQRIRVAEELLLDRTCVGGGWNYGNAQVLGQDLRPYVPTTALALLALQDRREEPAVARSLDWIVANAVSETGTMALGLAAVCLQVLGHPIKAPLAALLDLERQTQFLDNVHLMALAYYALTAPDHQALAFRISHD